MRLFLPLCFSLIIILGCTTPEENEDPETVEQGSPMELYGDLLIAVQMERIFPDGKTFVDSSPKQPPSEIMKAYESQKDEPDFDLKAFVLENFELPQQYATGFKSDTARSVEEHIAELWTILEREPDPLEAGTRIPLPYSYVVPGGRFGEIYYWDSYFTMLGLQSAGLVDQIQNMVDNFAHLIDEYGFIPNGSRTYFLGRSQPPFFALMLAILAEEEGSEVYGKYLPQLEREYAFWMEGADQLTSQSSAYKRVVLLEDGQVLSRYWDNRDYPRTEMYADDVETAERSERPVAEMYKHLRAGAESGWDFSSRWLADGQNLETIHTTDIIPVDLNALLYHLERSIAFAYGEQDNTEKQQFYVGKADNRKAGIQKYCWNEDMGFYTDYDFVAGQSTGRYTLAGVFPMSFKLATQEQADKCAQTIQEKFLKPGGVVTTLRNTGQQWDAPNGWAPLQWMTIWALNNYGKDELANTIKDRWVDLNEKVYQQTGKMVEKYNVENLGLEGGGGEYPVQDGFGWTNGVLAKLLSTESENLVQKLPYE